MKHQTNVHRSTAFIQDFAARYRGYGNKTMPITNQFRFIVRMAFACHERGVPYSVLWERAEDQMKATVLAVGAVPTPKALPKPPAERPVGFWKPSISEAVYRLDAYANAQGKCPGFVIEHSSGLSLVQPSDSGELGVNAQGEEVDFRQNWRVTHKRSGQGFGLELTFKRATDALLLAAAQPLDWTQEIEALKLQPAARRANYLVLAKFGNSHIREHAKHNLEQMEQQ